MNKKKNNFLYRLVCSSREEMSFLDARSLGRFLTKSSPKYKIREFMQECTNYSVTNISL